MAFTFQLGSTDPALASIADVRLLITDTDTEAAIFADALIAGFLRIEGNSIKKAAAQALDYIASRESLVQKRITTLGLSTDGPAVAKDLRVHAASLRSQSEDEAEAPQAAGLSDVAFIDLGANAFGGCGGYY